MKFSHTVPRRLTHRATIAEVFLTSAARIDADAIDVGAQVPRFHAFHSDVLRQPQATYDPLLFAEVCRQCGLFVAHEFFGAPEDHKFVVRTFNVRVLDAHGLRVRRTPSDAVVRCGIVKRFERRGVVTGLELTFLITIDGVEAFSGDSSYSWMPGDTWDCMRARSRSELGLPDAITALDPGRRIATGDIGRLNPYNVVIGPLDRQGVRAFRTPVVVDLSHPTMFDHPLDHVPGMLQMEVVRQSMLAGAARVMGLPPAGGELRSLELTCVSFGELDLPTVGSCELEELVDEEDGVRRLDATCTLWQDRRVLSEARASVVYPPAALERRAAQARLAIPERALSA